MYTIFPDIPKASANDRRQNGRLRHIFDDASVHLQELFKLHDDWVGTSIDYAALRMVHERYRDLTPQEVRTLVTAIGDRQEYCVSKNRLTSLYP